MDERYCTPEQFRENYDRIFADDPGPGMDAPDLDERIEHFMDGAEQPRKAGQSR
jgi:hypothetical protein